MADPVSVSLTLQQCKCILQCVQFAQRQTNDMSGASVITLMNTTINANQNANSPPTGMADAPVQSAAGVTATSS